MTVEEFNQIKGNIDSRYRDDVAALERVWVAANGTTPPGTMLDPTFVRADDGSKHSPQSLGIQSAARVIAMHSEKSGGTRRKYQHSEEWKRKHGKA